MKKPSLAVELGGLRLKNPVMTASGTCGYAEELAPYTNLSGLGAVVVKTITLLPRVGNPAPRIAETPSGMLNSIGLQNVGIEAFLRAKLPILRRLKVPLLVNIAGKSVEEYAELAKRLEGVPGVAALELNISCPNVAGGLDYGTDPQLTREVVRAVKQVSSVPVIPKLSPNVTDITLIARAAADGGADALSLINTLLGVAIDPHSRRPKIHTVTGGLSGPAIKPVALRMVWQVAQTVPLPLIGIGGIQTGEDAVEFLLAGATAVQVGTATFVDPRAPLKVRDGIAAYCARHGVRDVRDLVGAMRAEGE
ncbi:MAG: dihydroorotate dehydrogenase [Candidatus Methylomirabilales bacterium]